MSAVRDKMPPPMRKANDKSEIPSHFLRNEPNRTILRDASQPVRSIFNIGDSRHDEHGSATMVSTRNQETVGGTTQFMGATVNGSP